MPRQLGFDITSSAEIREDAFLFGESPSRIVVSVQETLEDHFIDEMKKSELPFTLLGHVTKGEIRIDEQSYGQVSEYKDLYDNALEKYLKK
jgi:phosphoribosylformylglycinamidine synthase